VLTLKYAAVAVLSIWHGTGSWSKTNFLCLVFAHLSGLVTMYFNDRHISLVTMMVLDFFGLMPTVKKTRSEPSSESAVPWYSQPQLVLLTCFRLSVGLRQLRPHRFPPIC